MKTNKFRGDLTDISAKKAALVAVGPTCSLQHPEQACLRCKAMVEARGNFAYIVNAIMNALVGSVLARITSHLEFVVPLLELWTCA